MPDGSDATPQVIASWASSLTALMPRPLILTGFFRDILSRHFQGGNIEHPELQQLLWRDDNRSNILIEVNTRWHPDTTGQRPAVIVKRNDFSNVRIGIDDRHQGSPSDGKERFTTFWSGSHTLFCIGGTGAQAEVLGAEVQRELTEFGPLIRDWLQLMKYRVLTIESPHVLEESTENFVVPVTVGYMYSESWCIDPGTPKLAKVSLNLSTLVDC